MDNFCGYGLRHPSRALLRCRTLARFNLSLHRQKYSFCGYIDMFRMLTIAVVALTTVGCASPQQVLLSAGPNQKSIIRNGVPALISHKKHTVMLRPNTRAVKARDPRLQWLSATRRARR